jgi:hypothetical protein
VPGEQPLVPDDEWIIRLVNPAHFDPDEDSGARVQTANLRSKEWSDGNRPSIFVESRKTVPELELANP